MDGTCDHEMSRECAWNTRFEISYGELIIILKLDSFTNNIFQKFSSDDVMQTFILNWNTS